jgi:tetratricopeptide (TPR) repeat protein
MSLYAEIYTYLREPQQVEQYHNEVYHLLEEHGSGLPPDYDTLAMYRLLYITANNYVITKQFTQAVQTYNELFDRCNVEGSNHRAIYLNLALAYVEVGEILQAEPLLNKVEAWNAEFPSSPDTNIMTMHLLSLRGTIAHKTEDYSEALEYFQQAEECALSDRQKHYYFLTELYQLWIESLESAGMFEEACEKHKQYYQYKEHLNEQRLEESRLASEASFKTQIYREKSRHLAERKKDLQAKTAQQEQQLQRFATNYAALKNSVVEFHQGLHNNRDLISTQVQKQQDSKNILDIRQSFEKVRTSLLHFGEEEMMHVAPPEFLEMLQPHLHKELSVIEQQVAFLIKSGFLTKQMVPLLSRSESYLKQVRRNITKKLMIPKTVNLKDFLRKL